MTNIVCDGEIFSVIWSGMLRAWEPASEPLEKKYLDEFNTLYDKYLVEVGAKQAESQSEESPGEQ